MFSERMRKVVVTYPKHHDAAVIKELHRLNAMHIMSHEKGDLDIGSPLQSASELSALLVTVRSLMSHLGLTGSMPLDNGFRAAGVKNFAGLEKQVHFIQREVAGLVQSFQQADSKAADLAVQEELLSLLSLFSLPLDAYGNYSSIGFLVGFVTKPESIQNQLSSVAPDAEVHIANADKRTAVAVFYPMADEGVVSGVLAKHDIVPFSLVSISGLKGSAEQGKMNVVKAREACRITANESRDALKNLGKKWHDFLLLSDEIISIELERAEAPLRFGSSENIRVASGWVPASRVDDASHALRLAAKESMSIDISAPSDHDAVPVKLNNRGPSRPFEFFMDLYSLPKYQEIDPTLFIFFTFPLFFGIILGDVGYGLIILLLLWMVKKKIPASIPLVRVITPAALSSVFFGFVFGEILGFEELFGYHLPHLLNRIHQIDEMIVISVIIGIVHINLGLLLGFLNELHHAGVRKAMLAKGSWWLLQIGTALLVASITGVLDVPRAVGALVMGAAIIMLYLGEGIIGMVELPGLLSNILSYTRLMAVGLASVGLAAVVNDMSMQLASAGGVFIVLAVFVGVIGHTINIALGLLGGFLQSLRLHYVEFFTKFYEGGAIPFKPFGERNTR